MGAAGRSMVAGSADGKEQLWFLNTLVTMAVGHEQGADGISVVESVGPRGDTAPLHVHRTEDEVFHVLEGAPRPGGVGGRLDHASNADPGRARLRRGLRCGQLQRAARLKVPDPRSQATTRSALAATSCTGRSALALPAPTRPAARGRRCPS